MNDILNKTIVLVLNRNWQAINIRTPAEAFCQMATNVATALHRTDSKSRLENTCLRQAVLLETGYRFGFDGPVGSRWLPYPVSADSFFMFSCDRKPKWL